MYIQKPAKKPNKKMRKNRQEKLANKRNVCHLFRSTCFDVMLTNACHLVSAILHWFDCTNCRVPSNWLTKALRVNQRKAMAGIQLNWLQLNSAMCVVNGGENKWLRHCIPSAFPLKVKWQNYYVFFNGFNVLNFGFATKAGKIWSDWLDKVRQLRNKSPSHPP